MGGYGTYGWTALGGRDFVMKTGIVDLVVRTVVFIATLVAYFLRVDMAAMWQSAAFTDGFAMTLPIWFVMMLGMVVQFATNSRAGLVSHRNFKRYSRSVKKNYSEKELQAEMRKMNAGAIKTLLFWLALGAVVTVLYMTGVFGKNEVLLVVATYYFCDALCMVIWCPLQKMFMKCRCCNHCRIYGWGYFLVFGPLVLLPGLLTYSLAAMSLLLFIKWEIAYAKYPERFWEGSNTELSCGNCPEKSCVIKRKLQYKQRVWSGRLKGKGAARDAKQDF